MFTQFLLDRFEANASKRAIVWKDQTYLYSDLLKEIEKARDFLLSSGIEEKSCVSLEADFSPRSIAMLLALIEKRCIVVPLTASINHRKDEFRKIAHVRHSVCLTDSDEWSSVSYAGDSDHPLLAELRGRGHPGLILFSSGSTGASKAAIHDFVPLLSKFETQRKSKVMISFLLFDHIGGMNTLFYVLSNAGTLVTVTDRTPASVMRAIETHKVQVLPTSPTFLRLLIMSTAWKDQDASSLELITYGTEPMPASTLQRTRELFPNAELQQTYGLSELGILRSKSRSSESLWVKIGGEGFETRVRDGLLEIKAASAMLGYLNAASPFTEDGWFKTGDMVEIDGDYFRILGRKSDLINVGGEKVYPAEVENILLGIEGVEEAVVTGESNPIVGSMVRATVRLSTTETVEQFRIRMRKALAGSVSPHKIPQKVVLSQEKLSSDRFKTLRAPKDLGEGNASVSKSPA